MTLEVHAPYTDQVIRRLPMNDAKHVEKVVSTLEKTFKDRQKWIPLPERLSILEKLIILMTQAEKDLTLLAAEEGGKPYIDSKAEVERAINGVKLAIIEMHKMGGTEIPMGHTLSSQNRMAYTLLEPIGPVLGISAFNHPLNLIVHQVIPAVATGCPILIKPALKTPLSCLNFVEMLYKAGLPKNWCQAVICPDTLTANLAADGRFKFVSFIGSAKVGWQLRSKLSPGTHITLEHGGAAPVIIEPDADLKEMIPLLLKGGFYHAGQVCVSVQRVFVHEKILRKVSDALVKEAAKLKVGDPLDQDTDVGPLISPHQVSRIHTWVLEAKKGGAKILCGGKPISQTCYPPTILLNPPLNCKISKEEVFGPVMALYSYKDRHKAIASANALPFCFQGAVFTQNIEAAFDTVKQLKATAVMVNDHTAFRVDWMPFGGRNLSGLGMGGIPNSMRDMVQEKLMVIRSTNAG